MMESALSKHLFVYSSLRKGFHQHAYDYLTQFFSFVSPAKVQGNIQNIREELFATPASENSFIEGELYKLNEEHDFSYVFGQLDDYEGLITEQDEKPLYRREITRAYKDDGEIIDSWIFWYNGDTQEKPIISPGNVLDYTGQKISE